MAEHLLELFVLFEDDLDEEEMIYLWRLYKADKNYHKKYPRWSLERLQSLTDTECERDFRFTCEEILELMDALHVQDEYKGELNGLKWSGLEGFCILLFRMLYPKRYHDMVKTFGRHISEISVIFNGTLRDICAEWRDLLTNPWGRNFMSQAKVQEYAAAISAKGAPLNNIIGFVDGTIRPICRPSVNQEEMYNGHKRKHCMKFQDLMLPNGIIAHLYGPYEGRRHDATVMRESGLVRSITHYRTNTGNTMCVFGDSAYAISAYLITPYKGANLTQDEHNFNAVMSQIREPVEWGFDKTCTLWAFVDFPKNQKILLQPVAQYYAVATLLTNCHTCLRSCQTAMYFGMVPPTLREYLS